MSRAAEDLARAQQKPKDRASREERKALLTMKREARSNGATLDRPGHGGLSNSLVLTVLRRDQYRCKVHGDAGEGTFGGLRLHHKGGLDNPVSAWLKLKGKSNETNNLVTVCARGHDEIHNRDRAAQ